MRLYLLNFKIIWNTLMLGVVVRTSNKTFMSWRKRVVCIQFGDAAASKNNQRGKGGNRKLNHLIRVKHSNMACFIDNFLSLGETDEIKIVQAKHGKLQWTSKDYDKEFKILAAVRSFNSLAPTSTCQFLHR